MLVTLSVVTLTVLPRHPPVLRGTDTSTTVTGTFPVAHDSVGSLAQLLALSVRHVAGSGELAQLAEPAIAADAPSTRAEAVVSTDLPIDVLALAVVTLTVLPMNTAVSWWVAGTLPTLALPSSKTG